MTSFPPSGSRLAVAGREPHPAARSIASLIRRTEGARKRPATTRWWTLEPAHLSRLSWNSAPASGPVERGSRAAQGGSVWLDAYVVGTYETTYASVIAVFTRVTNFAVARCCCVRRWRCAAANKEHGKDKNQFHENLQRGLPAHCPTTCLATTTWTLRHKRCRRTGRHRGNHSIATFHTLPGVSQPIRHNTRSMPQKICSI